MSEDKILDCIKNNPPETLKPLSKAFGSLAYILCYHVFKNLPLNDSMDINNSAEVFVDFMTDYIDKNSAKYIEHNSVEGAVTTYLESCQWLVEHKIKGREEILAYFLLFLLPAQPLLKNIYYLNDVLVYIQEKNCLAFIIDPLKLSRDKVYETIGGVDEALSLCFDGLTEGLDWERKNDCLLRPAFVSMIYPEILKPHVKAMTSGIALIFDFDKINTLDHMIGYMELTDEFSRENELPPGFNIDKLFDYQSRQETLQAYAGAFEQLCRQCYPDAKAVLQYLVKTVLTSTAGGASVVKGTPELFALVKDLARPLKLTEAEIKTIIDDQERYMDEIIIPIR